MKWGKEQKNSGRGWRNFQSVNIIFLRERVLRSLFFLKKITYGNKEQTERLTLIN